MLFVCVFLFLTFSCVLFDKIKDLLHFYADVVIIFLLFSASELSFRCLFCLDNVKWKKCFFSFAQPTSLLFACLMIIPFFFLIRVFFCLLQCVLSLFPFVWRVAL